MNMRKTGLLLTGGLAVMLVVFIVAYGILLATETMPVHIEIKEPPTADQQHGNIALPSVIESVDPEYLLTNIYSTADAPVPTFDYVDTDGDGNTVSGVGVFAGSGLPGYHVWRWPDRYSERCWRVGNGRSTRRRGSQGSRRLNNHRGNRQQRRVC